MGTVRRWGTLLLVVLALAGCTTERVGEAPEQPTQTASAASGPVDLPAPLELARVVEPVAGTSPTGSQLPGPDGEQLTLTEDDARTFGEWTGAHVGERAAMVANGEVIFAPEIQSAIEGGDIQITGQYGQDEANDLLARITGR
jgi:preprotein translocase subunit SecD